MADGTLHNLPMSLQRRACHASLAHFVRCAWHIIEPTTPLIWGWHLEAICKALQAHLQRKGERQRLYIAAPPGAMKSTIVSVMSLPWMWLHNPAYRAGYFSGAESVALRDSGKAREILGSEWYARISARKWDFDAAQDAKGLFRNTSTGFRYAASSGARVTGLRFDDIFLDDPMDAQEVYSDAYRRQVNLEWWPAVGNRLSDMRVGRTTLIMQRLHEDDFAGHATRQDPDSWDCLTLRSVRENEELPYDPRKPGELLFPERFPQRVLDSEKTRLGSMMYAAQHQQRAIAAEGNMFKRAWFRFEDTMAHKGTRFLCVDLASSTKTSADNTAICDAIQTPDGRMVIMAMDAARREIPDTRARLLAYWRTGLYEYIAVETANAGIGVIQDLRLEGVSVIELKADKDKISRSVPLQIMAETGRVWLAPGGWHAEFLDELMAFPAGKHDDMVDAASHAAARIHKPGIYIGDGGESYLREQALNAPEPSFEQRMAHCFA